MNKKYMALGMLLLLATAFAGPIEDKIDTVYEDLLKPIASGIAVVVLAFAGLKFMTSSNDPTARNEAKHLAAAAIVGLIVVLVAPDIIGLIE